MSARIDHFTVAAVERPPSFAALVEQVARLQAEQGTDGEVFVTLDDPDQCLYTRSHAVDAHGFDAGLDYPSDGDPAALAAYESAALHATAAALADPARAFAWADLPEEWLWEADDIEALAAMNAHPEVVLDAVHIAQCLPSGMGLLANLPNGYFSGDWTPFATHAVAERLRRQGYTLRGIGARCLWFTRTTTPSPSEAAATIDDLRHLYGHPGSPAWITLAATLATRPHLLLGYTEDFAELTSDLGDA